MTVDWNRQNYSGENPEEHPAIMNLREQFPESVLDTGSFRGEVWAVVTSEKAREILHYLALEEDLSYDFLSDLTAVHNPGEDQPMEIVYQLYSISGNSRFRVKMNLADGQEADSVVSIWRAAEWLEREVYDHFGIVFSGHPDMRRILNPEGFVGHPMRKDFPTGGRVKW